MKKALLKDSIKQIKNTFKRFISILLMAFLGVGFFAGLRAASPDMVNTIDEYYKEQNVYDIQILSTQGITKTDIEKISEIEEVKKAEGNYEKDGKIEIENKEKIAKLISIGEINKPVLIEGKMPQKENECLVEQTFIESNNKKIGDTINIDIEKTKIPTGEKIEYLNKNELTIVGIAQSPLYISRDRGSSNLGSGKIDYYLYIPEENIKNKDIYTNMYIKTKNEKEYVTSKKEYEDYINDVINQIKDKTEDLRKWYILDRNSNSGYVGYIQDTQSIENIGKVFPIVFFIVATLISLTSMTRMVEEERMEIGTLKALGYNKFQISLKYIIYASLACIIGGILGMSLGFVLLPKILWMMYEMMYQIKDISISFNFKYGGMGLGLICVCILGATLYTIQKELKEVPAALMRPKAPKSGNRVLLERIPFIWKKLNFIQKVTIRNLFRYKKRFLMTVIGILGCTALILTGFGIKDSVGRLVPDQFNNVFKYNMKITLKENLTKDEKENFASELLQEEEIDKIAKVYMGSESVSNENNTEEVQLIIPEDEEQLNGIINLRDAKTKEKLNLVDGKICITDKLAQLLNVKKGENITIKTNEDKEIQLEVSDIAENYVQHYIFITVETYKQIYNKDYNTNVILIKDNELSKSKEEQLASEIMDKKEVASVSNIDTLVESMEDTMKLLNYVVVVLIVSAGLLAFVVLYNLANVNISERIRELATIKVLGFYDKEVYDYVVRETTILTIIGIILGLVGGFVLNYYILGTCEINILRFNRKINLISYIYSALITIVFTIIVNIATYYSLKKIDMIESLKSVE